MSITVTGTSFTDITEKVKSSLISKSYWYQMGESFDVDAYYRLVPEPSNPFDKNAIRVDIWLPDTNTWQKAGYVPKKEHSKEISKLITKPKLLGQVSVYKSLDNYRFIIS